MKTTPSTVTVAATTTALKLFDNVLTFVFLGFLAHKLGPAPLGVYFLARTVGGLTTIFGEAGLSRHLIASLSKDPQRYRQLFGAALLSRCLIGLFLGTLLAIGLTFLDLAPETSRCILVFTGSMLLGSIAELFLDVPRAQSQFVIPAALSFTQRAIYLSLGTLALFQGGRLVDVLDALAFASLLHVLIASLWILKTRGRPGFRRRLPMTATLRDASPFGLGAILGTATSKVPVLALFWFWNEDVVGQYAPGAFVLETLVMLTAMVASVLYPTFVRSLTLDRPLTQGIAFSTSLKILMLAAISSSLLLYTFSPIIVITLCGEGYDTAIGTLRLLALVLPWILGNVFATTALQATRAKAIPTRLLAVSLPVHILLGILLVPEFGAPGAACALLIHELLLATANWVILRRLLWTTLRGPFILKALGAHFALGAILYVWPWTGHIVGLVAAGMTALSILFLARPLSRQEWTWLRSPLQ